MQPLDPVCTRRILTLSLAALLAACGRSEPPSWDASGSVAPLPASFASLPSAREPGPDAAIAASPSAASARPSASTPAPVPVPTTSTASPGDPGALPQTEEKPQTTGAAFDARIAALWEAIVTDSPEKALPSFFPVGAYEQVKDIPSAANDWKRRLVGAYNRDIHVFHTRLGANAASAKFVRVEVPMRHARWVKPHEELNKGGYWRVFGTRLFYEDDGKERFFELLSMISWRGEWYFVHLRDFK